MPTPVPSYAPLPAPPSRADPANFAARGDAFLGALPDFQTDSNAIAASAFANATEAQADAVAAEASRVAAAASQSAAAASAVSAATAAGAPAWVSGTTYALGAIVYSPVTFLTYRRRIAGGGTTDPSADTTNWALAAIAAPQLIEVAGTTQAAIANQEYALVNAAATTVTLPLSPAAGDVVWVRVANGRTDNVVNLNGEPVNGDSADPTLILDSQFASIALRYVNATYGWSV